MFCTKCGKEQIENTKFCTACGNNLAGVAISPPAYAHSLTNQQGVALWDKYFSWQGRISRKKFWIMSLYIAGISIINIIILSAGLSEFSFSIIGVGVILMLMTLMMSCSITVRAAHNYGKTPFGL